jgi:hypothetical protein
VQDPLYCLHFASFLRHRLVDLPLNLPLGLDLAFSSAGTTAPRRSCTTSVDSSSCISRIRCFNANRAANWLRTEPVTLLI